MNETICQTTVRKAYKEKLRPTPAQERELERVLWRCRMLYNTALEQRIMLSHVLQDVLARLDTTYHAFFRRVQNGQTPGYPRFHGRTRYHSFTYKEYGNGARLENGYLFLSKIGRIAVRWSRPIAGTIKTVTIAKRRMGGMSPSRVRTCPQSHSLRPDGKLALMLG